MVGAIRVDRWLTLGTYWGAMNRTRFIDWVRRRWVRRLRRGEVVVLHNLPAPKAREVEHLVTAAGPNSMHLPPYSHDMNPIEPRWALFKKRIRTLVPHTGSALRRTVQRDRSAIRPRHC
jgi:transposase